MMHRSNLTICYFLPSLLQRLDSCGIEGLILNLEKILGFKAKCFFFHVGEQNIFRWCKISRMCRVINQFKATVTAAAAIIATDLCAGVFYTFVFIHACVICFSLR